ncbi:MULTISPECIES: hypothetical protein [unclassified Bradyrhizobium]|uniref:hypothetical protein n=1 Tax=unclassified Bradyrhizobium TaxID=2631580 RepID=UPI00211E66EF|nr:MULTISPECIES: hypothetical protein [unclassified Bradyrhizobium]MDD1534554.1 hypothetical protein [Bradyrhizobium sp. WBOS8]MDD1581418.1 hypothetical protein [Bradyrhizobium sp. WBOS4]UUO49708.1 hypothetical protein DCM78_24035 [Bradyrhizobium sp. WBOS04]UUO58473.1 hypothetical protein DCM80_04310 [Bradyrhizobium sp. WBOS08]
MTSRRVIIGKYADGVSLGVKAALPGYDALAESDDSPNLSFNSNWNDIVPIIQSGFLTATAAGGAPTDLLVSSPGYVPYVDARKFEGGNLIRDDYTYGTAPTRIGVGIGWRSASPLTLSVYRLNVGDTCIYVVYGVPVVLT